MLTDMSKNQVHVEEQQDAAADPHTRHHFSAHHCELSFFKKKKKKRYRSIITETNPALSLFDKSCESQMSWSFPSLEGTTRHAIEKFSGHPCTFTSIWRGNQGPQIVHINFYIISRDAT